LECICFIDLYERDIEFSLNPPSIKYLDGKKVRTYIPDLLLKNEIVEIKPSKLIDHPLNVLKFSAARKWCKENKMKFSIMTDKYDKKETKNTIEWYFNTERIWFLNQKHYDRWSKNAKNS